MKFEIPKEIKAKPKLMGFEMKELIFIGVSFFLIFTMLRDLVHTVFVIPYFFVSILLIIYLVVSSSNNPEMKNYMSIILYFKRDKNTYHALDYQKELNNEYYKEEGEDNVTKQFE